MSTPYTGAMLSEEISEKIRQHEQWIETGSGLYGDFSGCDLMSCDLRGRKLRSATFRRARLFDARFDGACLENADFVGAELAGASLVGANLSGAQLDRASLYRADLFSADLRGASFVAADLQCAILERAVLEGADFTRANLSSAILRGTAIDNVVDIVRGDLEYVLSCAPDEAQAVLDALEAGQIDGNQYEGHCACLLGTIARVRNINPFSLPDRQSAARGELAIDASSPIDGFGDSRRGRRHGTITTRP